MSDERRDGFDAKKRAAVLSYIEEGQSISTALAKVGITSGTFYRWRNLGRKWHGEDCYIPPGRKPERAHGDFWTALKQAEATAREEFFKIAKGHAATDPRTSIEMLKVLDERFGGLRASQRLRRLEEEKKRQELKILRAKGRLAEAAGKDGGTAIFLGVTALLDLDFFTPAFKDELREALCNGKIIAAVARDLANEPAIGEGP